MLEHVLGAADAPEAARTNARAALNHLAPMLAGLSQPFEQADRKGLELSRIALAHQQQREFVPAEPGDKVPWSDRPREPPGEGEKQCIAGIMPLRVVDQLEVVDVEQ